MPKKVFHIDVFDQLPDPTAAELREGDFFREWDELPEPDPGEATSTLKSDEDRS